MNILPYIHTINDFPTPGIAFKDISPLLADPQAFSFTINTLAKNCSDADVIVGLDARGFIFAAPVAFALQKPFVMIRKKGKLPGDILSHEYSLEYGSNSISIQKNAIIPGQKVAIIDDVLATGGTAQASAELITQLGGVMQGMHFVIELVFLHGRDKLAKHHLSSVISL